MSKKRKRILFYYLRGIADGGSDYSLFYHIKFLDKSQFEPIVLYRDKAHLVLELERENILLFKHNYLAANNPKKKTKNIIIKSFIKYIPGSKTIRYIFKSIIEVFFLLNFILTKKIDLIHLNHGINFDRPALFAGILTGKSVISHYRGLSKLNRADVFLSKFVKKIISISEYARHDYIQSGVLPSKCIKIYNGIDLIKFSNKKIKTNNKIIVGNIGRLEAWKGQHVLLKAIPLILLKQTNVQFVFVGNGSKKKYYIELSKELGIQSNVTFLNSTDDIIEVFKTFNIFVHTSIEPEPFGRVIIEAMAMGLPVISTNIGGPKEIISNNINGYLIKPDDPELLSEKIIHLITHPEIRFKFGKSAIKTVKEKYDIRMTTENIEKLYKELLSNEIK